MKYSDGNEIKIGDWVKLWDNCYGTVVCLLENNEYSNGYPENQWNYLKSGVVIKSDKIGLIHYNKADEDLELISRIS